VVERLSEIFHIWIFVPHIEFVGTPGNDIRIKLNAYQHHGVRDKGLEWEKMPEDGVDIAAERLRAAGIKGCNYADGLCLACPPLPDCFSIVIKIRNSCPEGRTCARFFP
jgi:hypothetical protein